MIRTRFLVALGAIYLLLVAFILAGQFILLPRLLDGTKEIAQDTVEVLEPIHRLESLIRKASFALYSEAGQTPLRDSGSLDSNKLAQDLNNAFETAIGTGEFRSSSKQSLKTALKEWRQAHTIATNLVTSSQPSSQAKREERWRHFQKSVDSTLSSLDRAHQSARQQIEGTVDDFQATYQNLLTLIWSGYVVGVIVVIIAASKLARSVLLPLEELTKAISEFGQGNLSYRVTINSQDELGRLAQTINKMASQLHESQSSLKHQAARDSLTGLLNHGEFYRCLRGEVHENRREEDQIALILVDLDSFKAVNDTFGHQEGDQLLRMVAHVIQQEVRSTDYVTRYGGDEFAVLLPHTSRAGAAAVAERIRTLVAQEALGLSTAKECGVTISIGIAIFPDDAQTGDDLVAAADQALYLAKNQGKNQLVDHPSR